MIVIEEKGGTVNKDLMKTYEQEIKALVTGVSATCEPILYVVTEFMIVLISRVIFHYWGE